MIIAQRFVSQSIRCIQTLRLNSKSIAITKNADHIFTLSLECWYIHFILSIYCMFYRLSKLHSFIALDLDIHLVNNESLRFFSENLFLILERCKCWYLSYYSIIGPYENILRATFLSLIRKCKFYNWNMCWNT